MMYEADDDELTEVDSDATEVEHVVPKKILAHSLQWRHENGGLWSVKVRLQYNDGSKTDRYVGSAFFGDSKEGLHLVRAYTKSSALVIWSRPKTRPGIFSQSY